MSLIIRVAHSFARKTDNVDELLVLVSEALKLSPLSTAVLREYMTTGNGKACRNVDLGRKIGCSDSAINNIVAFLSVAGILSRSGEYRVVNWQNIRKYANNGHLDTSEVRQYARAKHSKAAKAQPSITIESVKSLIETEVKTQLTAMTQRMLG